MDVVEGFKESPLPAEMLLKNLGIYLSKCENYGVSIDENMSLIYKYAGKSCSREYLVVLLDEDRIFGAERSAFQAFVLAETICDVIEIGDISIADWEGWESVLELGRRYWKDALLEMNGQKNYTSILN